MAMEGRQVSRKVIGENPERLRQSAKQSTTVCGQAGRGAVAGRHLPAVQQSSKSGFSTCQVLWKIVGRSASHAAVCHASSFMCATQELKGIAHTTPLMSHVTSMQIMRFNSNRRSRTSVFHVMVPVISFLLGFFDSIPIKTWAVWQRSGYYEGARWFTCFPKWLWGTLGQEKV